MFLAARRLMRLYGFTGAPRVGAVLGVMQYRFGGRTRRRCLRDLATLQSRAPDDPLVEWQLRQAYQLYPVATLEVLAMMERKVDVAILQARCRIDGLPVLAAARQGKGAILLITHSGNSLLLAVLLAQAAVPMTVVYRRPTAGMEVTSNSARAVAGSSPRAAA